MTATAHSRKFPRPLHDLLALPIAPASLIATVTVFGWNYATTHMAFRARLLNWRNGRQVS